MGMLGPLLLTIAMLFLVVIALGLFGVAGLVMHWMWRAWMSFPRRNGD